MRVITFLFILFLMSDASNAASVCDASRKGELFTDTSGDIRGSDGESDVVVYCDGTRWIRVSGESVVYNTLDALQSNIPCGSNSIAATKGITAIIRGLYGSNRPGQVYCDGANWIELGRFDVTPSPSDCVWTEFAGTYVAGTSGVVDWFNNQGDDEFAFCPDGYHVKGVHMTWVDTADSNADSMRVQCCPFAGYAGSASSAQNTLEAYRNSQSNPTSINIEKHSCRVVSTVYPNDFVGCEADEVIDWLRYEPANWSSNADIHTNPEVNGVRCCKLRLK